ncbi:MAG: polyprenyl synthetase family protein [Rhodothermales bacterium]
MKLKDIQAPISAELDDFRAYFRTAMRNDVRLLDLIVQYLLRQKGKQLRPTLVLLSAKAAGQVGESTFRGAALVELLHTATLVHDDVVDDADRRRGVFSINALWKNKIAVLLGDFLLSRGLLMALDTKEYALLHVVSDAVRRMSEGELLQIEKARKLNIDEETYFRIISDKTASLLSACTRCGAVSVGAPEETVERLSRFGESLGIAFQIRDDLFDFGANDVGKPLGIDIKEKKMTLPLIHALRHASASDRRSILRMMRSDSKSPKDLETILSFVRNSGGLEYATEEMNRHASLAREELLELPESEARNALDNLVTFTINRAK